MAITLESEIIEIGATETTLLTAPAATTYALSSLLLGNVDGANDATVTLTLTKSGGSAKTIVTSLPVEAGTLVEMLPGGGKIYLEAGDALKATASAASDINALLSFGKIT